MKELWFFSYFYQLSFYLMFNTAICSINGSVFSPNFKLTIAKSSNQSGEAIFEDHTPSWEELMDVESSKVCSND
jgi:hypothetical protein